MQLIATEPAGTVRAKTSDPSESRAFSAALQDLLRVYQLRDRERICCFDITVSECYALETLVRFGPLTLGELASRLHLDKSTTSRILRALEEKAYARRAPHAEDRRALSLEASAAGRELYERIQADLQDRHEGVLRGLEPEVRQAVLVVIRRLRDDACANCAPGGTCG